MRSSILKGQLKLNSLKMGKCDLILLLPQFFKTSFWKLDSTRFSLPLVQIRQQQQQSLFVLTLAQK